MPEREVLRELVRHMNWANAAMLSACAGLRQDQLAHEVIGTYGRLEQILVHLARAQGGYTRRLAGWEPGPSDDLPEEAPFPGVPRIAGHLAMTGAMLENAVEGLNVGRRIEVTGDDGPYEVRAWVILLQAAAHATEHRQQIATSLTALGIEPPEPDLWSYWREVASRR